jgi:hypothetical protein
MLEQQKKRIKKVNNSIGRKRCSTISARESWKIRENSDYSANNGHYNTFFAKVALT